MEDKAYQNVCKALENVGIPLVMTAKMIQLSGQDSCLQLSMLLRLSLKPVMHRYLSIDSGGVSENLILRSLSGWKTSQTHLLRLSNTATAVSEGGTAPCIISLVNSTSKDCCNSLPKASRPENGQRLFVYLSLL